jgi:predicted transcriptional regulator
MNSAGHSNTEIADVMGMSEAAVRAILQGEMPERLAALEIGKLARNRNLTAVQAQQRIQEVLREEHDFATLEEVLDYWESLPNIQKFELTRKALGD